MTQKRKTPSDTKKATKGGIWEIENLLKAGFILVFISYAIGFFVWNLRLAKTGVVISTFLQLEFIAAAFWSAAYFLMAWTSVASVTACLDAVFNLTRQHLLRMRRRTICLIFLSLPFAILLTRRDLDYENYVFGFA